MDTPPQGLATPVGERGEALSVDERQLVALARHVADPDLLVLDEASSRGKVVQRGPHAELATHQGPVYSRLLVGAR